MDVARSHDRYTYRKFHSHHGVFNFLDSIFTEKSDVWSYGVCLWEMLTLGSTPYSTVENNELESYLESGKRLRISSFVPEELENLMNKIWSFEAKGRVPRLV